MMQQKAVEKPAKPAGKPAIVVKNLTKEFIIPHERRTTLFENIKGIFQPSSYEKFVALKDVSFTVERGESVGIIGDNGSGKSTLLKLIANILRPSSGSIEVNGKITPFLELGVGFQPDMTARENIDVYSTMMGLSDKEIARNMDSVLEFAGLTKFRDTKLKNFSSGMQVRLAFATAIQRKPDILLIDEVLAVGDMDFQRKCLDVFQQYKDDKVTTLFVSHDLNSLRRFCDKTLLLNYGKTVTFGDTNEVIDRYVYGSKIEQNPVPDQDANTQTNVENGKNEKDNTDRWGNKKIEIIGVKFFDKRGNENTSFTSGDSMTIRIDFNANERTDDLIFGLIFYSESGTYCYGTNTDLKKYEIGFVEGHNKIDFIVSKIPMFQGKYFVTIAAHSKNQQPYDWHNKLYSFNVFNPTQDLGLFEVPCKWKLVTGD